MVKLWKKFSIQAFVVFNSIFVILQCFQSTFSSTNIPLHENIMHWQTDKTVSKSEIVSKAPKKLTGLKLWQPSDFSYHAYFK